jgi:lactoylglutathione lyase
MLDHLAYTIVYVDDVDKCTAFYRDVLGIPLDYAVEGWTQFKSNGAALVLHPKREQPQASPSGSAVHLTFRVDDLNAEYERLSARAVQFLAPPAKIAWGKHATLLDPEGNAIDLIEWVPPEPVRVVSDRTVVNDLLKHSPEAMEVLEEHGIRICGGCIVLLNASVRETAEYSGLSAEEASVMVGELNQKIAGESK